MPNTTTRFILANGEKFVIPVTKKKGGGGPEYPRSYDEARGRLIQQVGLTLESLRSMPKHKRLPDEAVICIRMHPDLIAKSYEPEAIFQQVPFLEKVGSRNYGQQVGEVAQTKKTRKVALSEDSVITSRIVFARGPDQAIGSFLRLLDRAESMVTAPFKKEVQSIERFDILSPEEQLSAFDRQPDWTVGRVELVLHPSRYSLNAQMDFLLNLFADSSHSLGIIRPATYENGPTFVSCVLHREDIPRLAGANPLRTARPMMLKAFEELRSSSVFSAPPPPLGDNKSTIKVGMFDGGLDPNHPHLKGHVEHDESLSISSAALPAGIAHGTAVAGVLLYGPLNHHDVKIPLPLPPVSVVSFRVLPTSDPKDIDLFESIDVIENVVPIRKDISVYNISFGPRGPIEEDSISRFTYALDSLAHTHKVTFCVAVGNDGEAGPDLGRIQAPSDLVNGFGVGAFSERDGKKAVAPYSCVGPGRECAKAKPDLVAFGGCDQKPIHLVSVDSTNKALSAGTSFSTPIVASLAAQAVHGVERGNALLARTLLIHTAKHPENRPDHKLGHGIICSDVGGLLACGPHEVSILFQGAIKATEFVKLPFLLPAGLVTGGKIEFTWTVGILPQVDANQASDYTRTCIEDTFYPHANRFKINPPKGISDKARTLDLTGDVGEINRLLEQGWKRSEFPNSQSGNVHLTEANRRIDLKWESVVRRRVSKTIDAVQDPFLVLHAIPRGGMTGTVDYAAVLSMKATDEVDLYQAILQRNPALQPVRLRAETELRVRI